MAGRNYRDRASSGILAGGKLPFTLSSADRERLRRYEDCWAAYLGTEPRLDEEGRPFNFVRPYVDVLVDMFARGGWTVEIEGDLGVMLHGLIHRWLERQNYRLLTYEAIIMAVVTGDVFIRLGADGQLHVVDSSFVFPEWDLRFSGKDRRMTGCWIVAPVKAKQSAEGGEENREGPEFDFMCEYITPTEVSQYYNTERVAGPVENPLGFIPVVHIQNMPMPAHLYGYSEVWDLIPLSRHLESRLNSISKILRYHEQPIVAIFGARPADLTPGPNKVWFLPSREDGTDIQVITGQAVLPATAQFMEELRNLCSMATGVPQEVLGRLQAVGGTSGVALHMLYLPLMQRLERKRESFAQGLSELVRMFLKWLVMQQKGTLRVPITDVPFELRPRFATNGSFITVSGLTPETIDALEIKIRWGESLPKDRLIELQLVSTALGMGLLKKEDAIKVLQSVELVPPGDPAAYLAELRAEQMQEAMVSPELPADYEEQPGNISGMLHPSETPEGAAKELTKEGERKEE